MATARNGELRALAQRVADAFPPSVVEVVVTGSVSRGVADEVSDIEMLVVTGSPLELEDAYAIAEEAGLEGLETWGAQGTPTKRVSGYWMRQSGLADLLPSLREAVYVGLSAGSMVMAPSIGEDFVGWKPPTGGDETLGLVGFSMFPHLDHEDLPDNCIANAERWAAGMPVPCYAIDDQTAIRVTDDVVEVISEGHWKLFTA